MKKKNLFLVIVLQLLVIMAMAQNAVVVNGDIKNAPDGEITVYHMISKKEILKSEIKNGKFETKLDVRSGDFYSISLSPDRFIILILQPGEKVSIVSEWDKTDSPTIKGSPDSELFYSIDGELRVYKQQKDSIANLYQVIENKESELIKSKISQNKSSLATLFFIEKMKDETQTELYKQWISELSKKHPENEFVKELASEGQKTVNALEKGTLAPEITLPSPDGKDVSLSSLRGKVVLIDFWASWCGPCRAETPKVRQVYEKYNAKGFEIFGVSLDKDKAAWLKAIKDDKMDWVHVSDLKFWNSAAAQLYNVNSIPFTVLVDKDGNILAKALRADDLEKILSDMFK